ncbi:hypothetical protein DUI87_13884 [Hirundo rustica rustica]|uniref:Uncharacterized protein n=1 Tax=Hirundo rustica rustica TaxID=333673 RepID=A0A3M0KCS2_HIRRU|nr:hypothetical protein DUI87_13884 [Hirundo rustica rustica]
MRASCDFTEWVLEEKLGLGGSGWGWIPAGALQERELAGGAGGTADPTIVEYFGSSGMSYNFTLPKIILRSQKLPAEAVPPNGARNVDPLKQEFSGRDRYLVSFRPVFIQLGTAGSSPLGGASHSGMMECVMSLVGTDGPLSADVPLEDGGVVEEIRNTAPPGFNGWAIIRRHLPPSPLELQEKDKTSPKNSFQQMK